MLKIKKATIKVLTLCIFLSIAGFAFAQDSTLTELNRKALSANPGNTHLLLTGVTWFGGSANMSDTVRTHVKTSFNDFVDGVKETYSGVKSEAEDVEEKGRIKLNSLKSEARNALS